MASMTAPQTGSNRWLFGSASDLILGCGLGYAAIFIVLATAGPQLRVVFPLSLMALLSLLAGGPHYGATLLRVYPNPTERRAYKVFSVYLTLLVFSWFVAGLYSAVVGSVMLTLYLIWSPWHYTGQNFGLALMFLRRRGVEITPTIKRLIYATFVLSFLLTVVAIQGDFEGVVYAPIAPYGDSMYDLYRIGIPWPYSDILFGVLVVGYAATLLATTTVLLRRASARDLLPAAVLVFTQMLWFVLPSLARNLGLFPDNDTVSPVQSVYVMAWIGVGHSVQYLWVTTYYACGRESSSRAKAAYYTRCLLAGSALWGVPAVLYAWSGAAGLGANSARWEDTVVLVAAAANIHHFILDGAIWKLRNGRVAQILIRRQVAPVQTGLPEPTSGRAGKWLGGTLLLAGALWTFVSVATIVEGEVGLSRALVRSDLVAARQSLERLAWLGQDTSAQFKRFADSAAQMHDSSQAVWGYRESLARYPQVETWFALGSEMERSKNLDEAINAYEEALRMNLKHLRALYRLSAIHWQRGNLEAAHGLLERVIEGAPNNEAAQISLRRIRNKLAARDLQKTEGGDDTP